MDVEKSLYLPIFSSIINRFYLAKNTSEPYLQLENDLYFKLTVKETTERRLLVP